MAFVRPATILMVKVKTKEWKRHIFIPVPLLFVDATVAVASAVFAFAKAAKAQWLMELTERQPEITEYTKLARDFMREIRWAGPMTFVDVFDGSDTHVVVKTI